MKRLLYIGNKLNNKQSTVTSIDVLGPLLETEGYQLRYSSSKTNKGLRLLHMLYAVIINRHWVDYVLIDTYSTQNFYYAFAVSQLCRLLNLKYIPILHGGNLPDRLDKSPSLSRAIFKKAYKNIAPSEYTASLFRAHQYPNVTCIPNSILIEKYRYQSRDFDTIRLLWVRSFAKIYNPVLAVELLHALQKSGIPSSLTMVGPDKDGTLQQVKDVANTLGVTVNFTGKLSKSEWIQLSKSHNVFINTTNVDNMPVSVIEAMALGMVVISTNVGGLPYLVSHEETGFLVAPNSTQAFCEAIQQVLAQPAAIMSKTKKARARVEQFDWKVICKQWNLVLQPNVRQD